MLALYGHPFSSYTWKALIALYASDTEFEFRVVDTDHPEHGAFVQSASTLGKFPVLQDGDNVIFESTSIIEYLAQRHAGNELLVPDEPSASCHSSGRNSVSASSSSAPAATCAARKASGV